MSGRRTTRKKRATNDKREREELQENTEGEERTGNGQGGGEERRGRKGEGKEAKQPRSSQRKRQMRVSSQLNAALPGKQSRLPTRNVSGTPRGFQTAFSSPCFF